MSRSVRVANRNKLRAAADWSPRYPGVREALKATLQEPREQEAQHPTPV
jgi:hypothetical protein